MTLPLIAGGQGRTPHDLESSWRWLCILLLAALFVGAALLVAQSEGWWTRK